MTSEQAHTIVNAILDNLEGRSGFDWWWGDIPEDVQDEIRDDLAAAVERVAS